MDVDTASYTKMREYINSNRLPPSDLVRVEEFINYFDMEYPDPESGAVGEGSGVLFFYQADASPSVGNGLSLAKVQNIGDPTGYVITVYF